MSGHQTKGSLLPQGLAIWQQGAVAWAVPLIVAVGVVLTVSTTAKARPVPFSERTVRLSGSTAAFPADLDSDGDLDVLVASFNADTIYWIKSNGGGSFGSLQSISSTGEVDGAASVFAADLDGDGDLDVLAASANDDTIAWYENGDGQGAFFGNRHVISSTADGAWSVVAADIDRDGDVDVLAASQGDDTIAWYENDGTGSFGTEQVISTSADGAISVFAADVDGDGDVDVLSASSFDDTIAWYENDGGGSFGTEQSISTAADFAVSVFAADVDGDGDVDALSASLNDDTIAWHANTDGTGTFGPRQTISTSADGARSVFAADVDGDGDVDAVAGSFLDDTIAWFENTDGTGTFSAAQVLSTTVDRPESVAVEDLDRDGDLDVLFASSDKTGWLENEAIHRSAVFLEQTTISTSASQATSASTADVDGDGDLDVVYTSNESRIAWFENTDGAGTFGSRQTITTEPNWPQPVEAVDLDRDGDVDILAASRLDNTVSWWANNGGGTFGSRQIISSAVDQALSVVAGDVDGDGDLDVISGSTTISSIRWWENTDGAGSFGPEQLIASAPGGASSLAAADLDGDGDLDVLSNYPGWYENTDGTGTFGPRQVISSESASKIVPADLDGDGDLDVLAIRNVFGTDSVRWWENTDGQGTFGPTQEISTEVDAPVSVFAADLDQDGDLDVLSSSWDDDKLAWYENDGGGVFGPQQTISNLIDTPGSIFPADLDGNSDLDVVFASYNSATVAWLENLGGQFALETTDVAQKIVANGELHDLLRIDVSHRGRFGDSPLELASLELRLTDGAGSALTETEALALFETVRIYLDNGSGTFDTSDPLVASTGDFSSITVSGDGILMVPFSDGDANVQVYFGTSRTYFVVAKMTTDADAQTPGTFAFEHRTESSSTAEDRNTDIPLALEFAPNVETGLLDTQLTTASCRAPFDLSLRNRTVTTTVVCEAGTILSAGESLSVISPGSLTARAGQTIELTGGFSIQSGHLMAEIDPGLAP